MINSQKLLNAISKKKQVDRGDPARYIESFFLLLWVHDSDTNEIGNRSEHIKIWIPNSVIIKYRNPSIWYFNGKDGQVLRKKEDNLSYAKILLDFRKNKKHSEAAATVYSFDEKV